MNRLMGFVAGGTLARFVPMAAAVGTIPVLLNRLGTDTFGLLLLIWVVIGYAGVLDLGIPRGIIQVLARNESAGPPTQKRILGSAFRLLGLIGLVAGVGVALGSHHLVGLLAELDAAQMDIAARSLVIMALGMPAVLLMGGLRSVFEFRQDFHWINGQQAVFGALVYVVPCLVVLVSPDLRAVVASMVGVRVVQCVHLGWALGRVEAGGWRSIDWRGGFEGDLVGYGSWLAAAAVLATIGAVADRFLIGMIQGPEAVTYFSTPMELLTKLDVVAMSLTAVLFPYFSRMAGEPEVFRHQYQLVLKLVVLGYLPVAWILVWLADPLLAVWVGAGFAEQAGTAFRILSVSILPVALSYVAHTVAQAAGGQIRSFITYAWVLLIGLPLTYLAIVGWGLEGAAWMRVVRMVGETLALAWLMRGYSVLKPGKPIWLGVGIGLPATGIWAYALSHGAHPIWGVTIFPLTFAYWRFGLDRTDRALIPAWVRSILPHTSNR